MCGQTAQQIFWEMPLVLVNAWEHYSYRTNGIDTKSAYNDNKIGNLQGHGALEYLKTLD